MRVVVDRTHDRDEPKGDQCGRRGLRMYQGASVTERILAVIVPGIGRWHFDAWGRPCSRLARRSPTGSAIRLKLQEADTSRLIFDIPT
jgi:hypothetical protein